MSHQVIPMSATRPARAPARSPAVRRAGARTARWPRRARKEDFDSSWRATRRPTPRYPPALEHHRGHVVHALPGADDSLIDPLACLERAGEL